ncbi:heavy metal translocating P-type ATPase metal-binding domain-containing protein [Ruficoccus sp. ZRK36]|uniref:heavy metal translocating P-type ATPase metal-binding domain-containing protein n=1 Tax=Ruficoccus sp. ZRK36 TaxID=2866311 RepID=UPI0031F2DBF1
MNDSPKTPASRECTHCGTHFRPHTPDEQYCCKGCEFVHGLIEGQGLDQFYQLRRGASDPVKGVPFQPRDYAWLEPLITEAETENPQEPALVLDVQGISCIGCVWLIDKLFDRQPGGRGIEVNAQRGQMRLSWQAGAFDAVGFLRELQQFGYLAGPATARRGHDTHRLTSRLGLCGAFALNAMMFTLPRYLGMEDDFPLARWLDLLTVLFATLCMATGGTYFITRAVAALRRGVLHIDLPIALGVSAAYLGSLAGWLSGHPSLIYFDFVAIFIFLMLLGRWTQEYALEKNRNRLLSADHRPENVTVETPGGERAPEPLDKLRAAQRFFIEPGGLVPVCARLEGSEATFSLEWINGESEPRIIRAGELVPAGALASGMTELSLVAVETWKDSLLRRLLLISQNSGRHAVLERVLKVYLIAVLTLSVLGGLGWILAGAGIVNALQVFISVLVVSCPCALGVAFPLAGELAVSRLRREGVFVREDSLWQRLGRVRHILFDKTGTLTLEAPRLRNPEALATLDTEARAALGHLIERSLHPVSRALRENLGQAPATTAVDDVVDHAGYGLVWHSGDDRWSLGRPGWSGEASTAGTIPPDASNAFDCEFRRNGAIVAAFAFEEEVRPDAMEEIAALQQKGFQLHVLSGDRQQKVGSLMAKLGLPEASGLGGLSPQQKADWIETHAPDSSLMIGDGANDSLAFDAAACRGTPVVDKGLLEQKADFYLVGRSLRGLARLFELARRRRLAVRNVFGFAVVYNALAVLLCLAGLMNPLIAAIIMPLSSLVTLSIVGLQLGRA